MNTRTTASSFFVRALATSALILGLAAAAPVAPQDGAGKQSGSSKGADDRAAQKEQRDRERAEKEAAKERARRLEKLDRVDRAALDANLDYALPRWTPTLDWVGDIAAPSFDDLRGKVVVIQTFTTKGGSSRAVVDRLVKAMADFKPDDVRFIAIHTPEGSDKAEVQLAKAKYEFPVAIDRTGDFCDAIGAFKKPVNIVVNRTGDVKFAGLTTDGVVATVQELIAESFDPTSRPNARRPEVTKAPKDFPLFREPIQHAQDLRGKQAPAMGNVNWWNGSPNMEGKLVIVDFWATWCGPCKKAIPHMNQIATSFRADVQCMGISDESNSNFEKGLKDSKLNKSDFAYPVGIDPSATMKRGFSIGAIPHVAVISSDGIVRWQGHPDGLTSEVVRQLVDANRAVLAQRSDADFARWKRALAEDRDRGGNSRDRSR